MQLHFKKSAGYDGEDAKDLDDAINKYTEAMQIAKECSSKLDSVTKQINEILNEDGNLEEFKDMNEE